MDITFNTIEEAIEDFKAGNFLIAVDDEDRENEGDFIIAAEKVTPEKVNFMMSHGRGVLCAPLSSDRCRDLDLEMQVSNNTSLHETPFTITVDLLGHGCTTGDHSSFVSRSFSNCNGVNGMRTSNPNEHNILMPLLYVSLRDAIFVRNC